MAESAFDLNLGREAVLSLLANFSGALFGFIGVIIFARQFSVAGFGSAYVLLAAVAVAHTVTGGIGDAVAKRASEADVPTDQMLWVGLLSHTAYWMLVGVSVLPTALFFRPFGLQRSLIWGGFVAFVGVGYFLIASDALTGDGAPARANWADAVRSVITLGSQLGFILIGFGVESILLGLGIASLLVAVGIVGSLSPKVVRPTRDAVRSVYEFAVWSTPRNLLDRLHTRLVLFFLGTLSGGAAAARYKASRQLTMPSSLSSAAFRVPLSMKISADASREEGSEQQIRFALSFLGLLPIPIFFGALVLGNELIVTTYGSKYTSVGTLLALVALGRVIGSYVTVLSSVLYGNDYPAQLARIRLVQVIALAVFGSALYPFFGVLGIVGGFVISQLVGLVVYALATRSYIGRVWPIAKQIATQVLAAGLMAVAVFWTETELLNITSFPDALLVVGLGVVVYATSLLVLSGKLRSLVLKSVRQ